MIGVAATELAAIITDQDEETITALKYYGMHLGTAFQLVDDVLDYSANQAELGKSIGDDLAEGKPTLPLIYAMKNGSQEQASLIRGAIERADGKDYLDKVLDILNETNALSLTMTKAEEEAEKAIRYLDTLESSEYKDALVSLAKLSVDRKY